MHVLPALDIAQVVTPTEVDSEEPDAECRLGWIWLATWEDSREDVRWWPRLMKADGGLNATAAPVIMAARGGRWRGSTQEDSSTSNELLLTTNWHYSEPKDPPTWCRWHRASCWRRREGDRAARGHLIEHPASRERVQDGWDTNTAHTCLSTHTWTTLQCYISHTQRSKCPLQQNWIHSLVFLLTRPVRYYNIM